MLMEVAKVLDTYSLAGIAAAEAIAIVFLWRHIVRLSNERREDERLLMETMTSIKVAMSSLRAAVERSLSR